MNPGAVDRAASPRYRWSVSDNPFEPPVVERSPELDLDVWHERERLLPRESVARAASIPLFVVAAALSLAGLYGLLGARRWLDYGELAGAILHALVGIGVRGLRPWARVAAIILSVAGVGGAVYLAVDNLWLAPSFAFMGLILGVPAMILSNRAITPVFTREYARIISATPALRYQAPRRVWLSFLLLVAGAGVVLAVELSHPRPR